VKLRRADAAQRARIGALHAAYNQAVADAAKRERDQAAIHPNILPLLLNLHSIFPPVDEQGKPLPNQPHAFSVALQSDSSPAAIKRAFLKASVLVHPDKQAKSNVQRVELSSLLFPILQASYNHFNSKQ
jgi:P2-related tail formation protein